MNFTLSGYGSDSSDLTPLYVVNLTGSALYAQVICETDAHVVELIKELTGAKARYAINPIGAIRRQPHTLALGQMLFVCKTVCAWWLTHWFCSASQAQVGLLFSILIPLLTDRRQQLPVTVAHNLGDRRQVVVVTKASDRNPQI